MLRISPCSPPSLPPRGPSSRKPSTSRSSSQPPSCSGKGSRFFTNPPSPIVVVLSGSMEPAFQRGDILFLWNRPWSWPARLIGADNGKSGNVKGTMSQGIKMEGISGEATRTKATTKGLFAWETGRETEVWKIVVYNVRGNDIPIVHRVVRTFGGG